MSSAAHYRSCRCGRWMLDVPCVFTGYSIATDPDVAEEERLMLRERLAEIRRALDGAFALDTAFSPEPGPTPSAGHCAVVAAIVQRRFGGETVSATVAGQSHWFNRIGDYDADLTGDQFGLDAVQFAPAGELYPGTRVREPGHLNEETRRRSALLESRMRPTAGESREESKR